MLLSWGLHGALGLLSAAPAAGHVARQAQPEIGAQAYPFDMSAVSLTDSRWMGNQNRTVNYLKFVDVERLLYNFRANHGLSTKGASPNGGWDAPDFPFRTHAQGHYLTGWAHCYATLRDSVCRDRATYFVAELAKCQANNAAVGFAAGYLSGFPESEFTALEEGRLSNGNVPYYAVHKTLAGLLDVWRHVGDTKARDVMLALAGWVDARTSRLSYSKMQAVLGTEFGGLNDVLAEIHQETGDPRWIAAAQRFDHAALFEPLAANRDQLNGLHANTQVPKWIGAAREFRATGLARYRDIARNAWNMTVRAHTYAIGGNSQAEHFRAPNAIAQYLQRDTAEACNTYNMLKLTRELWTLDPQGAGGSGGSGGNQSQSQSQSSSTAYFDFYERALLNHLLGQQNPADAHGHVTYFTPLNPGGRRGVGPAWGGGTWSTDYGSFWCCQGTALETNTKLADSVYFRGGAGGGLFVNLFTPSVLRWAERGVTITQSTAFPVGDTTTLTLGAIPGGPEGDGKPWDMSIRIPAWTAAGAEIRVNGAAVPGLRATPGTYATIAGRRWKAGDKVTVRLPMQLRLVPANDNPNVAAVAYGPVILAGDYGDAALSAMPTLALGSLRRGEGLVFTGTADGRALVLRPFYDMQAVNYNVYWLTSGQLPAR